ncbi:MAG TPA: DNA-3-methyladenine glycosylase [Bacillales bacterium]|nr:DNA-3-methyladenine glycosylase [Bacillales bacterium]
MWQEEVAIEGPYDFEKALPRLAFDPLSVVDLKEKSLKVPLFIEGKPVVAVVKGIGTNEDPKFVVSCKEGSKPEVMAKLTRILKWDTSLAKVSNHFSDTDIGELFERYAGTPLICDYDLYRALMKNIIHQQVNMKFAYTLTERFVKTYGFEREGIWFYPQPEKVARLTVDELRELQFSQRKAEYAIDTSRLISEGELVLDDFWEMEDEEIVDKLVKIRGIGRWTAECVLLFGLGRENLLPTADVGLQNAVKKWYGFDEKPKPEELRARGREWSPYQSYASLYLWESLGNHTIYT